MKNSVKKAVPRNPHASPPVLLAPPVQSNSVEPSIYSLYSC